MIYKNTIFIHIPRTGGTSIESAAGISMGNEDKHLSASEIRENVGEEFWENAFKFSFIRNPWDRMISLYNQPYFRNKTNYGNQGLEYFIKHYQPAEWEKQFYYQYLNTDGIDFVGKFEERENDLLHISRLTGIFFDSSIHERKTNRNKDYRMYYNNYTVNLVYDLYQKDIEKYKYKF